LSTQIKNCACHIRIKNYIKNMSRLKKCRTEFLTFCLKNYSQNYLKLFTKLHFFHNCSNTLRIRKCGTFESIYSRIFILKLLIIAGDSCEFSEFSVLESHAVKTKV